MSSRFNLACGKSWLCQEHLLGDRETGDPPENQPLAWGLTWIDQERANEPGDQRQQKRNLNESGGRGFECQCQTSLLTAGSPLKLHLHRFLFGCNGFSRGR